MRIVDADGHVSENAYTDEISKYMPKGGVNREIFPALDHFHMFLLSPPRNRPPGSSSPDADGWRAFLDATGIEWSVLYPTRGLAVGRITSEDWAIAACRAYNNWLHDKFLNQCPQLKGMALIPLQDPEAAVEELRRAVTQLGMLGAMLPSTGEGLRGHYGTKVYWPLYEEAEKLGCSLAVHGGSHHHLGLDGLGTFYTVLGLGHPFGLIAQLAGMFSYGVFDRFPKLRVAFLEGGAGWVPFVMDRLDRGFDFHPQLDVNGEPLVGPRPGEKASAHLKQLMQSGQVFVGFDCDDESLGYAVQRAGRQPFLFASDYPHESFSAEHCLHEIGELLEREDITEEDKQAALAGNAERFYGAARG